MSGAMMRNRMCGGVIFQVAISMLFVAFAAHYLALSRIHDAQVSAQSAARAAAAELAIELSEWTLRRGPQRLGLPVTDLLTGPVDQAASCFEGTCTGEQGARHFLAHWRKRLQRAIPEARASICVDRVPTSFGATWQCDPGGPVSVLKLGWPSRSDAAPAPPMMAVVLGPAE